jgi:hypothetical protein
MYLRVTAFKSDPANIDRGINFLRDRIIPAMKQAPGFVGATCLVNREKGEGAASTIWESLEAMNKAEQLGQQSRTQSAEATGLEVVDVDRFEITVLEMAGANVALPRPTRLITGYGDPDKADAAVALIRQEAVPRLKALPGFGAYSSGVNRMTGRAFTATSFATAEQLEASNAAVGDLRERVMKVGGISGLQIEVFETVLVDIKQPVAR